MLPFAYSHLLFAFPLPQPWGIIFVLVLAVVLIAVSWIVALRIQIRKQMEQIRSHYAKELELETRLRQGQKLEALGQLAGGIAHDFNNLLTVINGCAELLSQTLPPGNVSHDLVADIRRAGERATALTGQLLLFGRQRPVKLTRIDLNAAVADAVRLLGRVLGETVTVETRFDQNLQPVRGDIGLIHQIVLNLAVNARDAMPGGGTIRIRTDRRESNDGTCRCCLSIADTGTGMDETTQKKIFEPFFTTKDIGKGTGLGLATVYGIVQSLGAEIHFQSKLGVGTTFIIEFPEGCATDELETWQDFKCTPSINDLTPIPSLGTVLLFEDDKMVRSVAERVLNQNGYQVLTGEHVTDGVRLAREAKNLDLLITDVIMPQLSGPEVARLVQQFHPEIRVIYMSGYTPEEIARQGIEISQVAGFIQKPFTSEKLMAIVRDSFSRTIPDLNLDAV